MKCVLVWLQLIAASVAFIASATPEMWLPYLCDHLKSIHIEGAIGPCECRGIANERGCFGDQLVYRTEFVTCVFFIFLIILFVSGCKDGATRGMIAGKFMGIIILSIVCLLLPNSLFSSFGAVATVCSSIFLVVQGLLLIDFGYSWNEKWFDNYNTERRENPGSRRPKLWIALILLMSLVLIVCSGVGSGFLSKAYPEGLWIVITSMVIALGLLLFSITEWCAHGALLTSLVVIAYTTWLVYEAMAVMPDEGDKKLPSWVGLLVCAFSLFAFGYVSNKEVAAREALEISQRSLAEASEEGAAADVPEAERIGDIPFPVQCLIHASAALYISSALAPSTGRAQYGIHVAAVFLFLALYGWTLIAPQVLRNRDF